MKELCKYLSELELIINNSEKVKVEILTIHFGINHGSVLQCYALSKTLCNLGASVEVIDYVPKRYKMWNNVKIKFPNKRLPWKLAFLCASSVIRLPQKAIFRNYLRKHINLSNKFDSPSVLESNCPKADLYLVGSDQVWNSTYNGTSDKSYLLGFVPKQSVKASYAASIGKDCLSFAEGSEIAAAVIDFEGVSVREEKAAQQLLSYGIDARVDLDPVFFLNAQEWSKLASKFSPSEKYLLVYVIAQDCEVMLSQAKNIANKFRLKLYVLSVRPIRNPAVDKNFIFSNPSDFLALFKNASFVISNSFHGTAFSIIFHKQFLTFNAKYSSRILNILSFTGLDDRFVENNVVETQIHEKVDFARADIAISKQAESGCAYLSSLIEKAQK